MTDSWPEQDEALLRNLITRDLSASQIAARMSFPCSRNAVIGKIRRLGLKLARGRSEQRKPKQYKKQKLPVTRSRGRSQPELPSDFAFVPREVAPAVPPTSFDDRAPDQCCWPIGTGRPLLYCGSARQPGRRRNGRRRDYCEAHERLRVSSGGGL